MTACRATLHIIGLPIHRTTQPPSASIPQVVAVVSTRHSKTWWCLAAYRRRKVLQVSVCVSACVLGPPPLLSSRPSDVDARSPRLTARRREAWKTREHYIVQAGRARGVRRRLTEAWGEKFLDGPGRGGAGGVPGRRTACWPRSVALSPARPAGLIDRTPGVIIIRTNNINTLQYTDSTVMPPTPNHRSKCAQYRPPNDNNRGIRMHRNGNLSLRVSKNALNLWSGRAENFLALDLTYSIRFRNILPFRYFFQFQRGRLKGPKIRDPLFLWPTLWHCLKGFHYL